MRAADFWDEALDADSYISQMQERREQFERRISETTITDDERERFSRQPLRFLVLTEDFCTDSAQFIPPLIKLAQELENVELRILLRDGHRYLAARFLRRDGYQAIPVIIVLDANGDEIGYLVERPGRVYDELAGETRRFVRANPQLEGGNRNYERMPAETRAAVKANSERFREDHQELWTRWLFEDLATMIDGAAARRDEASAAD